MCIRDRTYGYNTLAINEDYAHAYHSTKDHYAYVKNGNGSFSVSYTHLDVYKRQSYGKALFFQIYVLPCQTAGFSNTKPGIIAVSYTHLDVYKRQGRSS